MNILALYGQSPLRHQMLENTNTTAKETNPDLMPLGLLELLEDE